MFGQERAFGDFSYQKFRGQGIWAVFQGQVNLRVGVASCADMVIVLTLFGLALSQQPESVRFDVEGRERTALVFLPSRETPQPPVVFLFHGHGGGSRQVEAQFRIHLEWPEAVVVCPQGLVGSKGITDPEGLKTGWQRSPGDLDDRDVKLFDVMSAWVGDRFHADASRTFVMGHSNGGLMTWVLQTVRGGSAAGFAGFCAPGGLWFRPAPVRPMFVVGGTDDELVGILGIRRFSQMAVQRNEGGDPFDRDGVKVYPGKEPVWVWIYEGGHRPPPDSGRRAVEFFKSL